VICSAIPGKFLPYLGRTMGLEDDRISLYKPTNIALVMEDKELYVNKDELMELSPDSEQVIIITTEVNLRPS
jgi:hypothetical protein